MVKARAADEVRDEGGARTFSGVGEGDVRHIIVFFCDPSTQRDDVTVLCTQEERFKQMRIVAKYGRRDGLQYELLRYGSENTSTTGAVPIERRDNRTDCGDRGMHASRAIRFVFASKGIS